MIPVGKTLGALILKLLQGPAGKPHSVIVRILGAVLVKITDLLAACRFSKSLKYTIPRY